MTVVPVTDTRLPKASHQYVTVLLILLTICLLVMNIYTFFSWQSPVVIVPRNVSVPEKPVFEENRTTTQNTTNFSLTGQWICGNGVADPREDCTSCPKDVEECACFSVSQESFDAGLGQSFYLCGGQTARVEALEINMLGVLSHKLGVNTSDGQSTVFSLEEGETVAVWCATQTDFTKYRLTLEKKMENGVRLKVDLPVHPLDSPFYLVNGERVMIGDTDIMLSARLLTPGEFSVQLGLEKGMASATEILAPGQSLYFEGYTIDYAGSSEAGFLLTVKGGGSS